jgi:hypothetical protein
MKITHFHNFEKQLSILFGTQHSKQLSMLTTKIQLSKFKTLSLEHNI